VRRHKDLDDVKQRAAALGLAGAVLSGSAFLVDYLQARPELNTNQIIGLILLGAMFLGYAGAWRGVRLAWCLAAAGAIGGIIGQPIFMAITKQRLRGLINPFHVLAAASWLGALFVLVVTARGRRAEVVSRLVNGFSPMALTCGGVVVGTGILTAWRHLKRLDALWTTLYGQVLMAKLCVVALVFALGFFNWRRQRARLGSEEGSQSLLRSAIAEVVLAVVVLGFTSVLVNVPSPR
jgi:copper transport protein